MSTFRIEPCRSEHQAGWLEMRRALWPDGSIEQHTAEMRAFIEAPERFAQFIAYDHTDRPLGFVEVSLRTDYVNGTTSSPVAFLEGLYVTPQARRMGVAATLVNSACEWAQARGGSEIASDALLDNEASHLVHRALGFEETERVVYFRKALS